MSYNPIFWENKPSQKTPISAENLRHMDEGILEAHRLIEEGGGGSGQGGFSPIATVTQTENGALIEIEDKNGKTSATVTNGKDGQNGQNGQDGVSPTIETSKTGTLTTLTITDKNGEKKAFIVDGQNGVGIQEIATLSESKEDGGTSYYEIVLTNGTRKQISVKNGSKGSKGDKGDNGSDATVTTDNITKALGYTPANKEDVDNLSDEIADQNARISEAVNTEFENEKGNMVQLLISELQGLPVFGVVDENNKVTITSQLSSGTYDLMYENEDGTIEKIGIFTIEGKVVNLIPTALTPNDITTIFDGVGYKNGYYASAAEPFYNTDSAFFCTGLMPVSESGKFYIKGCVMDTSLSHTRFGLMSETGGLINTATLSNWGSAISFEELSDQYYLVTINSGAYNPYYFYFSASGTGENVIVSHTPIE